MNIDLKLTDKELYMILGALYNYGERYEEFSKNSKIAPKAFALRDKLIKVYDDSRMK